MDYLYYLQMFKKILRICGYDRNYCGRYNGVSTELLTVNDTRILKLVLVIL